MIRKLLKSKLLYTILIFSLSIYFLKRNYQPQILSIPVVFNDNTIKIIGKNFGKHQKKSALIISTKKANKYIARYIDWSDTLIILDYQDFMNGQKIRVNKKLLFLNIKSAQKQIIKINNSSKEQYQTKVQQKSPWPTFRKNRKNTAYSNIIGKYNGKTPWMVQTSKGIFSSPVIDKDENIYIGSANHIFYAINSNGKIIWTFKTGEIIDSGAAVIENSETNKTEIILPSGDGYVYKLRTENSLLNEERIIWKFNAKNVSNTHYNNWFEGNIAIGYKGEIYAGNTNFNYYCLKPNGKLKWKYTTAANNWSIAAIADDGTIYWGSNDNFIHAVNPNGKEEWKKRTLGFIAASASIGSDGTIYIASFDSYLYALNPHTGETKWKFKTNDHIYASAALDQDKNGNTTKILFGSTDGFFYALNTKGELLWKYYTDDVIRASAAIGNSENSQTHIVYFGAGNGIIYALNTQNGALRWQYNTTSKTPALKNRNDINASIALGENGIYTAGEHGQIWYIPYDYPLYNPSANKTQKQPDGAHWKFISSSGNILEDSIPSYNQTPIIVLKLDVVENGNYIDANICNTPIICSSNNLYVDISPKIKYNLNKSADGHYLYIIPEDFVETGKYKITLKGNYYLGGIDIGNLKIGGHQAGTFNQNLQFEVKPNRNFQLSEAEHKVPAIELSRITAPLPPMLASLNQIGFDYMDWGMAIIAEKKENNGIKKKIIWTIGIKNDQNGNKIIDTQTDFLFPMEANFRGNNYMFESQNIIIPITGIPIPFNKLILSGDFNNNLSSNQAALFADTKVLEIPTFGKYLVLAGLANNVYKNLNVVGSFITQKASENWEINQKPKNIKIEKMKYFPANEQEGNIIFDISYQTDSIIEKHNDYFSICLIDEKKFEPLYINYNQLTDISSSANNEKKQISLIIPNQKNAPQKLRIIFMVNLYPYLEEIIETNQKTEKIY